MVQTVKLTAPNQSTMKSYQLFQFFKKFLPFKMKTCHLQWITRS